MQDVDQKWVDALRPYWGGGIVPLFKNADGTVNAERTMEHFARMHRVPKIGPNGEEIFVDPNEWKGCCC